MNNNALALFLVALSVVCGLFIFVLCLAAEGSRTEVTWYTMSNPGNGSDTSRCIYDASGRRPLAFAVSAFLLLVAAMFAELAYMLVFLASPPAQVPPLTLFIRTPVRKAPYLFLVTWICFAIAEALLMIGLAAESSHGCRWKKSRSSCHVVRPGLFAAGGVFGLLTVLFGIALYAKGTKVKTAVVQFMTGPAPTPSAPPPSAAAAPSAPAKTSTSA